MPHFFDRKETGRKETPLPRFYASHSCKDFTSIAQIRDFTDVFYVSKIARTADFRTYWAKRNSDSEQILLTGTKYRKQNSVSVEQIQDSLLTPTIKKEVIMTSF